MVLGVNHSIMAIYTHTNGFAVEIVPQVGTKRYNGCGFIPQGREYIIHPDGRKVEKGFWCDFPEKHWKVSAIQYHQLPTESRAYLECQEQATQYDLVAGFNRALLNDLTRVIDDLYR